MSNGDNSSPLALGLWRLQVHVSRFPVTTQTQWMHCVPRGGNSGRWRHHSVSPWRTQTPFCGALLETMSATRHFPELRRSIRRPSQFVFPLHYDSSTYMKPFYFLVHLWWHFSRMYHYWEQPCDATIRRRIQRNVTMHLRQEAMHCAPHIMRNNQQTSNGVLGGHEQATVSQRLKSRRTCSITATQPSPSSLLFPVLWLFVWWSY